jgi:hypothetical protein
MTTWQNIVGKLGNKTTIMAFTALIVAVGGQLLSFRQDSRMEFRELAVEYRKEVERLRGVEQRCLRLELNLSKEMDRLHSKMVLLESASQDLPFPHWLKSNGTKVRPGVMLAINKSYEDRFLLPIGKTAAAYIGKTDAQFWGEAIGTKYWEGDMKVIDGKVPTDHYEVDPFNPKDSIRVIKYPRRLGTTTIGIGGMVLPE